MIAERAKPVASSFATHERDFEAVLGDAPRLVRVIDVDAHEGPVYVAEEDALYFTTVPRRRASGPDVAIKRLALDGERFPLAPEHISVVRANANAANGMTLDRDGRLVVCEQGTRAERAGVSRLDAAAGERETLVDVCDGLPLNSPNDAVVAGDGAIWFTDPSYGFLQGFRPPPMLGDRVYRHDAATGHTTVAADALDKPNGLAFSPDERVLYVADSGAIHAPGDYDERRPRRVVAFDVAGERLANERVFADGIPGFPDGLAVDTDGRVYVSSAAGVHVLDADGRLLGDIAVPGAVNFTFGGAGRNVLFITSDTAVWAAVLEAKGA